MTTNQSLNIKIESLRKLMIETARIHGFSSPSTVKVSQELDELLLLLIREQNTKKM
ncbi:aspartyl-phosphate phosphatase Spo0E family protein [Metabacillus halosaccharovorans]|uniref:Spo0E family sporulation regulatory protein-aspartic acid phosphatase n=1 Tax=Metabacillus halosaccharovorans TaxID=930124 RepID=UPI00403DC3DD